MFNIHTKNAIHESGLKLLEAKGFSVDQGDRAEALIVRSANLHDHPFDENLLVVARAGAGVNNIPLDVLAAAGVPVLNTPGANANAVKELVLAALLIANRNLCHAWHYIESNGPGQTALKTFVETCKKQFVGQELPGKTLCVIGLGAIGCLVANDAIKLGMKVIGYDPGITVHHAWQLDSHVQHAENLDDALSKADFVSLHVPLTPKTENLMNDKALLALKPNAILLNFSRKEIVDNTAVAASLSDKRLRMYLSDFPDAAWFNHPQAICFPHLGASTHEAEQNCAAMACQQVIDYLEHGILKHAVNYPDVNLPHKKGIRLTICNRNIPNMVGQISTCVGQAGVNITDMMNNSKGDYAYTVFDLSESPDAALLDKIRKIDGVLKVRVC